LALQITLTSSNRSGMFPVMGRLLKCRFGSGNVDLMAPVNLPPEALPIGSL
jgi:hypothetical protein